MSTKKLKPLTSLFQQWSSSQQEEETDESSSYYSSNNSSSYRILLQFTNGLSTRVKGAEVVENPHLYRRAGVRTPAETAIRDSLGGYAWLEHLIDIVVATTKKRNNHQNIIYVSTKTQESTITSKLLQLQQTSSSSSNDNDNNSSISVIQVSKNPWGWDKGGDDDNDNDDGDEKDTENVSLSNLKTLHTKIQNCILSSTSNKKEKTKRSFILIWESLTPLVTVHGFSKTLAFLNSFHNDKNNNCLQIWPARIGTLTPIQHQELEDSSEALLYLNDGEMTMIRQGIREKGNIIRQVLPFKLNSRGKIEEEEEEDGEKEESSEKQQQQQFDKGNTNGKKELSSSTQAISAAAHVPTNLLNQDKRKIQLKLEDDDEKRHPLKSSLQQQQQQSASQTTTDTTNTNVNNRPRIYLQDDDPEFDDLDEEDPDDDLDI